jgi:hypothetical protein
MAGNRSATHGLGQLICFCKVGDKEVAAKLDGM